MADLNTNTLTNIDRICYCAGIRTCALGSTVDGGTLFHKGGNRVLVYCIRSTTSLCCTWYDTCSWALGLGTGWFFPTCNEMIMLYSCTDIRTCFCNCFWLWERTNSSAAMFVLNLSTSAINFQTSHKQFTCAHGIAVKTVYY